MEFLAYDRSRKRWIDPDDVYINGNGTMQIVNQEHWPNIINPVNIDIYPYIGRKDSEGNKIYEGSKVEYLVGAFNMRRKKGIVKWNIDLCAFTLHGVILNSGIEIDKIIGHIAEKDIK